RIASGSGSLPGPESGPVSRPTAGSSTVRPRSRSTATFSTVEGCSHISVCIAGATTIGARVTRAEAASRSSARPIRSRGSRTEVRTGWWLSASQVAAPTNSREERVGTTRTSAPSPTRPRTRCAVLYAAMPPPTPTRTRAPSRARSSLLIGPTGGGPGSEREVGRRDLGGVVAEQQRGRGVGIRLVLRGVLLLVDLADREQVLVDLAQRDRERLLLVLDVHERADELQQALGELRVVRVDLASAL